MGPRGDETEVLIPWHLGIYYARVARHTRVLRSTRNIREHRVIPASIPRCEILCVGVLPRCEILLDLYSRRACQGRILSRTTCLVTHKGRITRAGLRVAARSARPCYTIFASLARPSGAFTAACRRESNSPHADTHTRLLGS